MTKLKISVDELIEDLNLENKSVVPNEVIQYQLTKDDLDNIIDTVGKRIIEKYMESHRVESGDMDDLMLGEMIEELKTDFAYSKNLKNNKPKL